MSFPDGPEFSFHLKLGSIIQYLLTFTRIRGPKAPSYHGFFLWLGLTGSGGHDTNYKSQGEVAVRESGERMDWPSAEHLCSRHMGQLAGGGSSCFGTKPRIL